MPRLSKIGAAALAAFGWTSGSSVSASYLVVAGGGSGGYGGGGGGAGGFLTSTTSLNPTLSYTVTVGAGGAGVGSASGNAGGNSVFNSITANGGGYGATYNVAGGSGGSGGGGGANNQAGGTATSGQGNNGGAGGANVAVYSAGGGGGASAVGGTGNSAGAAGSGGAGTASSISGSSVTYAGGGGGSNANGAGGTAGSGGAGGGGAGSVTGSGTAGTANLGGGGGGAWAGGGGSSGNGGSGIVIISYAGAQQFSGGVVTSSGGNTIHTFTTSGTLGPVTPLSANYLVVAGGGGTAGNRSGGGGAGGLLSGSALVIDPYSTYVVTVGAGGAGGAGNASAASTQDGSGSSFLAYSATGGGGNTRNGGSGGGANYTGSAGTGTSGQGNAGGTGLSTPVQSGGGGGGAGAVGSNAVGSSAGAGGIGVASSISGTSTYYAGGGGGGSASTAGAGGTGGGGAGGGGVPSTQTAGTSGTANTGGGGGGGSDYLVTPVTQASGGSGVVIISYAGSTQLMAGGVVTIAGGNVIHTFNSSGYLTPLTLLTRSLRFRSSASAYLSRTFSTPTDGKKWTWSGWVKRGILTAGTGTAQQLFSAGSATAIFRFSTTDTLVSGWTGASNLETTAVYRDPAAWYHIMLVVDTTQATAANRVKYYVNGVQVTAFATTDYPTQNSATTINSAVAHNIAAYTSSTQFFDGYMAEVNFIDGQALAPTAFGTFNSYGVWQPITYGGSYGTNGFRLPFTNNASTTTLGYDFSPQGNNWTTNNISVTAGSTYDSMTDVPTLTSATAANFSTWNPLWFIGASTFSSGNLIASCPVNNGVYTTMYVSTGKWYAEVTPSGSIGSIGVNASTGYIPISGGSFGYNSGDYAYMYSGNKMVNNGTQSAYGSTWTTNDVIGIAIDADAGTVTMYKNNTSQGTIVTGLTGKMWVIAACSLTGTFNMTLNNGAGSGFTYTPPTGYLALNTFNL